MNCLKASQLISISQERPLTFEEKVKLRLHLLTCKNCRRFQKNCDSLSQMMKSFARKEP